MSTDAEPCQRMQRHANACSMQFAVSIAISADADTALHSSLPFCTIVRANTRQQLNVPDNKTAIAGGKMHYVKNETEINEDRNGTSLL